MAADEVRPASPNRLTVNRIAATGRADKKPMVELSPNHPEADHKPSLRRETDWIRVEPVFVAHEELAHARFSYELQARFHEATGLRVPGRRRGRLDHAHQVPRAAGEHRAVGMKLAPNAHVDVARPPVIDVDLLRRPAEIGDHVDRGL